MVGYFELSLTLPLAWKHPKQKRNEAERNRRIQSFFGEGEKKSPRIRAAIEEASTPRRLKEKGECRARFLPAGTNSQAFFDGKLSFQPERS